MNQPATSPDTRLDTRFSDPGADAAGWEHTRTALQSAQLFWITTVRADGRPHVTPLVAVWLDDALHFCTGPHEQKAANLRANPNVALTTGTDRWDANPNVALTTGTDRWDAGTDIVVEGRAERVTETAALQRLAQAWAGKWDGRWRFEARDGAFHHGDGGQAWVYAVRPAKVLAFGKDPFSHTSHRFPGNSSATP